MVFSPSETAFVKLPNLSQRTPVGKAFQWSPEDFGRSR
jgi:hypothetical protein